MIATTASVTLAAFRARLGEAIGADDHFFDMGGDSLAAEAVMTEISGVIGRQLPIWLLLDHPTAASLAEAIDHGAEGAA